MLLSMILLLEKFHKSNSENKNVSGYIGPDILSSIIK